MPELTAFYIINNFFSRYRNNVTKNILYSPFQTNLQERWLSGRKRPFGGRVGG